MYGPGHQFLAGAGFTGDEHAEVAARNQGDVFCSLRMAGLWPSSTRSEGL